jgi:putative membrane protein insertion efficiency factor
MKPLRTVVLGSITAYQRLISPATPRHCKYEPTCSRYAAQAVREFGILRGRHGGFDPVSAQRLFRSPVTDRGIAPDPPPS